MRKVIFIVLLAVLSVSGFCIGNHVMGAVKKPVMVNASTNIYSFDTMVRKADIIAEIEIVEMLRDVNEPSPMTFFKARLLDTYKDRYVPRKTEIEVMQDGNQQFIFNSTPLFQRNERLILFLKKSVNFEGAFWILGSEAGYYKVKKMNGKEFVAKTAYRDEKIKNIEDPEANQEMAAIVNGQGNGLKEFKVIQAFKKDAFTMRLKEEIARQESKQ